MPESSIGLMLLLTIFVCAALAVATRYHTDHPLNDLRHWLDRMHRRH